MKKVEGSSNYTYQISDEPQLPNKDNIIKWISKYGTINGEVVKAKIADRTYYITLHSLDSDDEIVLAIYVDVTAEKHLVTSVSIAILFIMTLCSVAAGLAGVYLGKKIENEQWKQKKVFENASHQLKTPLMVMQGYAEGLTHGVIKDPKQAAEIIVDETEKMALLIDEILNLSRLDSNDIKFKFENVSLETLLNDCLPTIEYLANKKNIKVEVSTTDHVVKADIVQLERAIISILSNAIRYAQTTIKVQCDDKRISIWNDGEGVPEEDIEKIFKRFQIGKGGNTGIGLSLTREVVKRHGWKIHAENTDGGMKFIITMK
ncbi:MAG: HAMP domain-containing histidine kinase [Tissierellia bacterium]|nr:HAMP domain-containing histidine kinase [Tissierellia bacterium]